MEEFKKVLMVTTNTSQLDDEHPTGVWFEEFFVPYKSFKDAGFEVFVASPLGGVSPIDPASKPLEMTEEQKEYENVLNNTQKLDDVDYMNMDGIFLVGGHGTMLDFPQCKKLAEILNYFYENHKLISAVCHGPAGFVSAVKHNGEPLVKGIKLTSFTNEEEELTQKAPFIPFYLEDKLREQGALFVESHPETSHVVIDDNFITGQNAKSVPILVKSILNILTD